MPRACFSERSFRFLTAQTPDAARFVAEVLAAPRCDEQHAHRFYRAEPVPAHWGDPAWPDSWDGGRWGPPYALLQGSLATRGVRPAAAEAGDAARPVVRRGSVAWAGGKGGPEFFVALARHPEWGHTHTVWADVLEEDMWLLDAVVHRPRRVGNWGGINASELVAPLPFCLAPPVPA